MLDDSCIFHAIHSIAEGRFGRPTLLAQRYLNRDLYKCLELPTHNSGKLKHQLARRFIDALKESKIRYIDDVIPSKTYKQYAVMENNFLKNILIKKGDDIEPLGDISTVVKSLGEKKVRLYFENQADKEKSLEILKKLSASS